MAGPKKDTVKEYATKRIRCRFSFRLAAAGGANPDAVRQELGAYVSGVTRVSAGRYRATLVGVLLPQQYTFSNVCVHSPTAVPLATAVPQGAYVINNAPNTITPYTVDVIVIAQNATAAPAAADAEVGSWVSVEFEGPETTTRQDPV